LDAFRRFVRLFLLVRRHWKAIAGISLLGLMASGIGLALPLLSKVLIDRVLPTRDVSLMQVIVVALFATSIAQVFLGALRGYYSVFVTTRMAGEVSLFFFDHVAHLPSRFFDRHRVGDLVARFGEASTSVGAISRAFDFLFLRAPYLVVIPPVLLLLDWHLALIALSPALATTALAVWSGSDLRSRWRRTSEAYASLGASHFELLTHIRTLKSQALEGYAYGRVKAALREVAGAQIDAGNRQQLFGSFGALVRGLGTAVFTWYAWRLILAGDITLGGFVAISAYLGLLQDPLAQFTTLFTDIQQTAVALTRMFGVVDEHPEGSVVAGRADHGVVDRLTAGEVRCDNITFGYGPDRVVLQDLSVTFPAKHFSVIVGASGAGKSTLLRLIARLETPRAGTIRYDGVPHTHLTLTDVRSRLSVVWQEIAMFHGTILDNLMVGAPDADRDGAERALRECGLDDFVNHLPLGLDTPIGEGGATLSGGQRQRLAVARALLRPAPLILLDEVTSNIDMATERAILNELKAIGHNRTIIAVTHRPQMAALADHVVMLEAGAVRGSGTHEELLSSCLPYKRFAEYGSASATPVRLRDVERGIAER